MNKVLYIVVPCYNEEEVLTETIKQISKKIHELIIKGKISIDSKMLLVDDGSKDSTWSQIESAHKNNSVCFGLKLSRNTGHQNALLAGLMTAKEHADMVISMDADLQDSIDAIDEMVDKFYEGNDIIYGIRNKRKKDTVFKRFTAETFYKIMSFLGAEIIYNHADYRLMSKKALEGLAQFKEVNLFLRGIVPLIGYNTDTVYYERAERIAGESKYPLKKMVAFAVEGITSFSIKPIRLITSLGLVVFMVSILMLAYSLARYFSGHVVDGWASIMVSLWAIGGAIILAIGVIGEYIGKIYLESKARPKYIIEKMLLDKRNGNR